MIIYGEKLLSSYGMNLFSEKGQICGGIFSVGWRSVRRGGGLKINGKIKSVRFELLLVYSLEETGALMTKLDQVLGQGEYCGINVLGQEVVDYLVEDWKYLFCPHMEINLDSVKGK